MEEGDTLALGPDARHFVDELNPRLPAPLEHPVQIVDGEADVMHSRSALLDKAGNRRALICRLQQLHQGLSSTEPSDARAVRVVQRNLGQAEYIAEKRRALAERPHRDAYVRNANSARGCWGH